MDYKIINKSINTVDEISTSKRLKVVSSQYSDLKNQSKDAAIEDKSILYANTRETEKEQEEIIHKPLFVEKPAEKIVVEEKQEYVKPVEVERPIFKQQPKKSVFVETIPNIRSDANVGDKAEKIRQMYRRAEQGTNVYKTLEVGVETLNTLDKKIDEYKNEIETFKDSSSKNDSLKTTKIKDLKAIEDRLSRVDKSAYSDLVVPMTSSLEENYMEEINNEFSNIKESLLRVEAYAKHVKELVNTFDAAKQADDSQITLYEDKIEKVNKKKMEVCRLVEEKLKTAVDVDKATAEKIRIEAENRKKEQDAKAREEQLQQTLTFGLSSILDKAEALEQPKEVDSITASPAFHKFDELRIEDELSTANGFNGRM